MIQNVGSQIEKILTERKLKHKDVAKEIGMSAVNFSKVLKKGSIDSLLLYKFASYFDVPISYFFDDKPLEKFGTGMAKAKDEGGGLKGIFGAMSKNLPQATEWLERAKSLSHENEELKAMVDSQQQTIQAHEATIEALKENITLLKESREQATGRVKHVVRSGEGEA
jgi:transcriptional regulator with XRE-family HTH domain